MKKIIAVILVAVMLLSFASCKKEETPEPVTGVPFDKETLAISWQDGALVFPNGVVVYMPSNVKEIMTKSGFTIPSLQGMNDTVLKEGEEKTLRLVGTGVSLSIICKNTTKEPAEILDCSVVGYNITKSDDGNHQIKFAGTLTIDAERAAVEEVIGIDPDAEEDGVQYYKTKNSRNRNVEIRIKYNSNNLINSIAFEIV